MARIEHIRADAGPYPVELLEGCRSGLILFGAAFLGRNDAIHMLDAGVICDVVDIDQVKLDEMAHLYPADWHFYATDAWWFAEASRVRYDVVSVDTWTGDLAAESLKSLPLWCSVARKLVTLTVEPDTEAVLIPAGWKSSVVRRSKKADWLVLERDYS